jgi:hypothetical protein
MGVLMLIPIVGIVFLANAGNCQKVFGCSCAEIQSPAKAVSESKTIFSGRILDIQSTDYVKVVTFDVDRAWKGVTKERLIVSTPANSAGCGIEFFEVGKEFLVYSSADENALHVILCSRTQPIETASEDLLALGEGYRPGFQNHDLLTAGQVSLSKDFNGHEVIEDVAALNATEEYVVRAKFSNLAEEPKTVSNVYNVVLVLDRNGNGVYLGANTYGSQIVGGGNFSEFVLFWTPVEPGEYTIRTFLISDWERPQIASGLATYQVKVNEKIDKLGEGDSNDRLVVESIDEINNSVNIIYNFCDETFPYSHKAEAVLSVGEYVSSNSVDAHFLGLEEGKAVFRFEANGGEFPEVCLV